MRKILILFSGGADSVLMVKMAERLPEVELGFVMFHYDQKHDEEIEYAKDWLKDYANQYNLDLGGCFAHSASNLLKGSSANYPGVHAAHVPARNTIFLAVALGLAESKGYDEIWHGADYSDRINLFPDCYQEYFVKMNEVAKICGSSPITIRAPLLGMTKEDVKAMLKAEGVDLGKVYSGYEAPTQI